LNKSQIPGSVFIVTYGNGHVAKVAPVVAALRERGIKVMVMALTLGYKQAEALGLNPLGYQDFLHLVDKDLALAYGQQLLEHNSHPDVDENESVAYLGVNYLEWVEQYGVDEARQRYEAGGRRSFLPVNFIGKVIDQLRPGLIVSTASPRSEQAAIEAGVSRGIPTLTMMDLFALPTDGFYKNKVFADRITLLSELTRKNLLSRAIDSSRLVVTGCPAYDKLLDSVQATQGAAWKRQLGWDNKYVVMWAGTLEEASDHTPDEYLGTGLATQVENQLRDWVTQNENAALIVRYHPSQYHLFDNLHSHDRVYFSNPSKDPLHMQLHASDCVVTQMSTVGFEGFLIGKRLITLSFSPMVATFGSDYSKLGLGESALSVAHLISMLDTYTDSHQNPDALPPLGRATPRVVEEMLLLLQAKSPKAGRAVQAAISV
jgi:CDP-Glycerol:Poly(glycerophosphate) glycerophosphotransferase